MEEAARQLEDKGAETISQLSLHLGYKNLSQFTRTFKDYFNCSPSDFLKGRR
jgi:AraC-like DNA-binding protein